MQYEGELVAVFGKKCRNASPSEALDYVFGWDRALYDLFRLINLRPLDEQECSALLGGGVGRAS